MTPVKVPSTPEPKTLETVAEQSNLVSKVRTFDGDIKAFKSKIETIGERMEEIVSSIPEHEAVIDLNTKLSVARDALKRRLESNSEFVKLTEELGEERLSLKDANENMSDFLLAYFAENKEKQIELGPHEAKEIIIKAKLGKAKDFQTNIFSAPPIDEGRKDLE